MLAFAARGGAALLAGLAGEAHPWLAALLLLAGINFAVALDAVGNMPFLRAVHAYERPQMTAVYRTNLDLSELLPALRLRDHPRLHRPRRRVRRARDFLRVLRLAVVAPPAALDVSTRPRRLNAAHSAG